MKQTKKLMMGLIVLGLMALAPLTSKATIVGSVHDFSTNSWNSRKGICSVCHTIHNSTDQVVPLWIHETTKATFTPYTSATLDATVGQPDGASKACLSCHDGTVAINSYGGRTNGAPEFIASGANLGTDLSVDHPVSFTYDAALAATDTGLWDPTTQTVPTLGGKTVQQVMLHANKMQCSSCHDVHKTIGTAPTSGILLKISSAQGALCLTCHKK